MSGYTPVPRYVPGYRKQGVMIRRSKPEVVEAMVWQPEDIVNFDAWVRQHGGVLKRHPNGTVTVERLRHAVQPLAGDVVVLNGLGLYVVYDQKTFDRRYIK